MFGLRQDKSILRTSKVLGFEKSVCLRIKLSMSESVIGSSGGRTGGDRRSISLCGGQNNVAGSSDIRSIIVSSGDSLNLSIGIALGGDQNGIGGGRPKSGQIAVNKNIHAAGSKRGKAEERENKEEKFFHLAGEGV